MEHTRQPYLRSAQPDGQPPLLCPPGWTAEPVGTWNGREQEVVYQRHRHQVLIVRGKPSRTIDASWTRAGWMPMAHTDGARMYVRDRLKLTRETLDRLRRRPVPARTLQRTL